MIKKTNGLVIAIILIFAVSALFGIFRHIKKSQMDKTFNSYIAYFKSAYDIMDKNYYLPVDKKVFDSYISEFKTKIFESQLKDNTHVIDNVKHIGTGMLIARLKDAADPFTNFYPPQMVKDFKQSVLGYGGDIGIEGSFKDGHYLITQVEPRSDAFKKGISIGDEILKVENKPIAEIPEDILNRIFSPPKEQEITLEIFSANKNNIFIARVLSSKYFKQSVFAVPTPDPGVACLKIKFFNEETGNDLRAFIEEFNKGSINKLILDLRDNGGGPPLAAWDISGTFLEPQQKLFYFLKRDSAPSGLITPASPIRYNGRIVMLINKGTGSAAEIFAGFMQAYHRAELIGENSAGKVYLKSLFDLSDGATIELTVAKGYLFNGSPIDAGGLIPDIKMKDDLGMLNSVVSLIAK